MSGSQRQFYQKTAIPITTNITSSFDTVGSDAHTGDNALVATLVTHRDMVSSEDITEYADSKKDKVCSHCFAMLNRHPDYPLCDNTSCESDDCWCHIKFCNRSKTCIHCSVLIYLHPESPLCNNASCVSDDCWCHIRRCDKNQGYDSDDAGEIIDREKDRLVGRCRYYYC